MIYLVRHGQTDWNLAHRHQGWTDIPLNETGRNEAKICAKELASIKIDRIISSDLSRAKETTAIINETLSRPISYDSRLREVCAGDLQGLLTKDITPEQWYAFNHEPHKIHAESLADVYARVKSFFSELDTAESTLVVTHGGVIRMVMYLSHSPHTFNQDDFEKTALQFKIKNTEVFSWDKGQHFQSLMTNKTAEKISNMEF